MLSLYSPERRALVAALKKARLKAGLTQTQLAEKLGTTQKMVSYYERCVQYLEVMEYILIARITGIDTGPFIKSVLDQPSWPPTPKKRTRRRT